jgi:hypothetical protein
MNKVKQQLLCLVSGNSDRAAQASINLTHRKVKTEYLTAEEDAQADAWNAALDAAQELNK